MRISIYMEFLAYKFGGAESYTASLVEYFQQNYPEFQIEIITESFGEYEKLSTADLVKKLNDIYGTNILNKNLTVSYFYFGKWMRVPKGNKLRRAVHSFQINGRIVQRFKTVYKLSEGADVFINASFNILAGNAKHNICLVHFPFKPLKYHVFWKRFIKSFLYRFQTGKMEKLYATSYDLYLPNSQFTSKWLKEYWKVPEEKIQVVYPPVITVEMSELPTKKNQILACSRIEKDKQLDKLIEAYSKSQLLKDNYELVIAGSAVGEVAKYVDEIKNQCAGVQVVIDPDRRQLEELYKSASVFWHAKGFQQEDPRLFEHFGITTVEAMSAGCIPVVIDKGGQLEIVTDDCGYRWTTIDELIDYTCKINQCENIDDFRKQCIKRSKSFNKESFANNFKEALVSLKI